MDKKMIQKQKKYEQQKTKANISLTENCFLFDLNLNDIYEY